MLGTLEHTELISCLRFVLISLMQVLPFRDCCQAVSLKELISGNNQDIEPCWMEMEKSQFSSSDYQEEFSKGLLRALVCFCYVNTSNAYVKSIFALFGSGALSDVINIPKAFKGVDKVKYWSHLSLRTWRSCCKTNYVP